MTDASVLNNPNAIDLFKLAHQNGFQVTAPLNCPSQVIILPKPTPVRSSGKFEEKLAGKRKLAWSYKQMAFKRFKADDLQMASPVQSDVSSIPNSQEVRDYLGFSDDIDFDQTEGEERQQIKVTCAKNMLFDKFLARGQSEQIKQEEEMKLMKDRLTAA